MPPAARITDLHTCPLPSHVGGPVVVGEPTVLIGYMPAARVGDQLICATGPDKVAMGESTVVIGNADAARLGDPTVHGGRIVVGCPTVIIGSVAQVATLKTDRPFCEECERKRKQLEAEGQDTRGVAAVQAATGAASGLHLGPPATQQAHKPKQAAPTAAQAVKPCDFDVVELLCKHCGKPDDRAIANVTFKLDAKGTLQTNHVRPTNKKRLFVTDSFEVMADDEVTVKIKGGPGYHDAKHPMITLTRPSQIGAPVVVHGQTSHTFKVAYTPRWFEQRLGQASGLGFAGALKQFFFPPPLVYDLAVQACGVRPQGHAFHSIGHKIKVYPGDTFKIALSLPARREVKAEGFAGTEGKARVASGKLTNSYGHAGRGTSYSGEARREGNKLTASGKREAESVDSVPKAIAKSIEISHNNSDITQSFKVAELIDFIANLREKFMDLVDLFAAIGKKSPQIGWSFSCSFELFSGSLEYSWGYKELSSDHTVYRYWKIEAGLTVVKCRAELAFGASLLKAKAQIYGALSGELKISASKEANPNAVGLMASVSAALNPGGEIGVRGALGDWIEVIGKVDAGFEGSTKIDLAPFKWTGKIDLTEGKGTFTVRAKYGPSWEGKASLWDKRALLTERTIIG